MGVYHKQTFENGTSTWIILQPTAAAKSLPKLYLTSPISTTISPHLFLFQSTAQPWKAYLTHLESTIRKDVCFSFAALFRFH
jgi:hypothetical protein